MIRFLALNVREKSGGRHDGATPDYRAFLYYKDADGALQELRATATTLYSLPRTFGSVTLNF